MMNSNEVRDIRFSKGMSGYKQEEVDNFLDKVEEDYQQYEAYVKTTQEKIANLTAELDKNRVSQDGLNNILISAQQFADKIIADANAKAEEIKANANAATAEAKNMLETFDQQLAAKRAAAEKELAKDLELAQKKQNAIKAVTDEIIRKQQASFDSLKLEIAQFKNDLLAQYKEHLELISKLPEDVAMDAKRVAEAVSAEVEAEAADEAEEIEEIAEETAQETVEETEEAAEPDVQIPAEPAEEAAEEPAAEQENIFADFEKNSTGFVINMDDEEEEKETKAGFSNDFFSKSK